MRKGGAIELDERPVGAGAQFVDAVGEDFLADAAVADDQDVGFARGDLLDQLEEFPHLRVFIDGLKLGLGALHPLFQAFGFLAELDRLLAQAFLFQRLAHEAEKLLGHVGFADEMERADLDRGDGVVERIVRGDDDDRQGGMLLADGPQQVESLAVGQSQVEQQNVGVMLGDHFPGLASRERGGDGVAAPLQDGGERRLDVAFVIDDSDYGFGAHGRCLLPTTSFRWKREPAPSGRSSGGALFRLLLSDLLANIPGHEDGFLLQAAKGVTGLDALAKIFAQKGPDAVEPFILGDMNAFVNQRVAVRPMDVFEADAVAQGHPRGSWAEKTDMFGNEHHVLIFGLGQRLDPEEADFFGVGHARPARIGQPAFTEGGSLRENNEFLLFGPGAGDGHDDRQGGEEAVHEGAPFLSQNLVGLRKAEASLSR